MYNYYKIYCNSNVKNRIVDKEKNMAQLDLNNIEKLDKARNTVHEKLYTTYTCFE